MTFQCKTIIPIAQIVYIFMKIFLTYCLILE